MPPVTTRPLMTKRPRLAVTLGDPAGIGPEVVLKALADPMAQDWDVTLVGTRSGLDLTVLHLQQNHLSSGTVPWADPDQFPLIEVSLGRAIEDQIQMGCGSGASGALSFVALERAIAQTLAGEFDAIVTAPIAKSAWAAAGKPYPGQTEVLAERAGVEHFGMLFVARSPHTDWTLRTLLATTHIPLAHVPQCLTPEVMEKKLEVLLASLWQDFGIGAPRLAIAGLNPHSGEQGQLGQEEQTWLIPWIEHQRQAHPQCQIDGPVPPDTLWVRPGQAWFHPQVAPSALGTHDAYIALYHDQGLIPVKLLAFDRAVNTTIGLPFVRTSPDHGTAFDIAGHGLADANSMKVALAQAAEMVRHRQSVYSETPQ